MRLLGMRLFGVAGVGVAIAFSVVTACSLGLDESLIPAEGEGDANEEDTFVSPDASDAGDAEPDAVADGGGACTKDQDCNATDKCFLTAGRCDVARGSCVYDVCKPPGSTCQASECNADTHTCNPAIAYSYQAASFTVDYEIGCGGTASSASKCFAAVYPFIFVGTANGVLAYPARNPVSPAPASVAVTGLGFQPIQIMASGNRVFFLGKPYSPITAGGPPLVPIAWLDVSTDPFAKELVAHTVYANWNLPAGYTGKNATIYARGNSTVLLVDSTPPAANSTEGYPSVVIDPTLGVPLDLTATNITFTTAGVSPQIMSGTRLLMHSIGTTALATATNAYFEVIDEADSTHPISVGSAKVSLPPVVVGVTPVVPVLVPSQQVFAASSDGAIFWSGAASTGTLQTSANLVFGSFVVDNAMANFDENAQGFTTQTYSALITLSTTNTVVGPVAMLDSETAFVTTGGTNGTVGATTITQTNVQVVKKAPLVVARQDVLPAVVPTQVGVAASNGLGYVLTTPSAPATTPLTVYVYDPNCP
ncbi:MAG: hypothetical protein FWD73_10690 [Polyangiaceae bacterium]|nr:hypothetical protein [Polyangiaceae bacterium]